MKAELREIEICDSVLDSVHGFGYTIKEIYVPTYNICINCTGQVNFFIDGYGRHKQTSSKFIKEIDIPHELIDKISKYIECKNEISVEVQKIFEPINAQDKEDLKQSWRNAEIKG